MRHSFTNAASPLATIATAVLRALALHAVEALLNPNSEVEWGLPLR